MKLPSENISSSVKVFWLPHTVWYWVTHCFWGLLLHRCWLVVEHSCSWTWRGSLFIFIISLSIGVSQDIYCYWRCHYWPPSTAAEEHWRIAESGQWRTSAHTGWDVHDKIYIKIASRSLGVEGDAASVADVAALLGGDGPALLLHHHVTLLKVTKHL